ncbi:hypothetical protein [Echinicola sp. 20G]|uniref:hypothetical protein n=1 Tax=Echinicola sp. 20G TaxID=2781961 RepID=UPI0019109F4F|nr:hypothetical protein [Echinicola sp. 20G]
MKHIKHLLLAFALLAPFFTQAQVSEDDELQLIQAEFGMDKKKLIDAYMDLPESVSPSFWTIYQAYEEDRKAIARERIMLMEEYLEKYEALDEETADDLAKRTLQNTLKRDKLHASYYKKFKKATSAIDAAKFLQLDDYIHSTIRSAMQEELPFIGEIR